MWEIVLICHQEKQKLTHSPTKVAAYRPPGIIKLPTHHSTNTGKWMNIFNAIRKLRKKNIFRSSSNANKFCCQQLLPCAFMLWIFPEKTSMFSYFLLYFFSLSLSPSTYSIRFLGAKKKTTTTTFSSFETQHWERERERERVKEKIWIYPSSLKFRNRICRAGLAKPFLLH